MTEKRRFTPRDISEIMTLHSVQSKGGLLLLNSTKRNMVSNNCEDYFTIIDKDNSIKLSLAGSSASFSPDGEHVAYEYNSFLYVYQFATQSSKKLAPLFSSEYFMGHMAEQNFVWSPDSSYIAYVSSEEEITGETPQVLINCLLYKTKGGRGRSKFAGTTPYHIYIISLAGKVERITNGPHNEHSISWSPDGRKIAFISNRTGDPDITHQNDLFCVDVVSKQVRTLLTGKGNRFKPSWSPDGSLIAFLADESAFTSKDSPAPDVQIYTISAEGKELTSYTSALDRRTDNIKWESAGNSLFFTAGDHGATVLFSVTIKDKQVEKIIQEHGMVKDYCVTDSGSLYFIRNTINVPDELFELNINGKHRPITTFNMKATEGFAFADAEMFWSRSFDGTEVQGWLMRPYNFDLSKQYPCILVMHGGPHNMYGFEFDEKLQILSAAGYGVLFVNPRGSSGYGQQFTNGNLLNWGGKDYEDLMASLDYVIKQYSWIDSDRLGLTGQSYGGFLTNWIVTQTGRFKAAVSDGGISNLISFAGTSIYHCLIEAEFNGSTWRNYDLLWKWSPLKHVEHMSTPTLFLHGEIDHEVPISQAEEMFSALKRLGIETQLVRYQNEGHGWRPEMLPHNRADNYERMIGWFNRFLN